jgi:hypothetical protein
MGAGISIQMAPRRRPDVAIGLDPFRRDRLIIRRRPPAGLLVLAAVVLVAALFLGVRGANPAAGILAGLPAALLLFGRAWIILDRRRRTVARGMGVLIPFWRSSEPLEEPRDVVVSREEIERNKGQDRASWTTVYTVSLAGGEKPLRLLQTGLWESAVEAAEIVAHFFRAGVDDRVQGVRRSFERLDLSLREGAGRQGLRAGKDLRERTRFRMNEEADGSLRIHIPPPRRHEYLGVGIVLLALWTVPVSLFGSPLFGLLPPVLLFAAWLKVAYGFRAELTVTADGALFAKTWGLVLGRSVRFRASELEEIVLLKPEWGGLRDVVAQIFDGLLVARSDRHSARFGYGLSTRELERLKAVLVDRLTAPAREKERSPTGRAPKPGGPEDRGKPECRIPVLKHPVGPVAGLALGALAGHIFPLPFGICVALPFLEHVLSLGGLLGLFAGLVLGRRRTAGRRGAAAARFLPAGLAVLFALYAAFYPLGPLFQRAPSFHEDSVLFNRDIVPDWRLQLGWIPTGIAASFLFWAALGVVVRTLLRPLRLGIEGAGRAAGRCGRLIAEHPYVTAAAVVLLCLPAAYLSRGPLWFYAAKTGNARVVDGLLRIDGELLQRTDRRGRTALHRACVNQQFEAVRLLVDRGADVNAVDRDGNPPLHLAVKVRGTGAVPFLQLLLDHGADPGLADGEGKTALALAEDSGLIAAAEAIRPYLPAGAAGGKTHGTVERSEPAPVSFRPIPMQVERTDAPPENLFAEAVPEGVPVHVLKEERADLVTYRFEGRLRTVQFLCVGISGNEIWVGTECGLLRWGGADSETAVLYGTASGMAGERVDDLAAGEGLVVVELSQPTSPGCALGKGLYVFDAERIAWRFLELRYASDFAWDGKKLWVGGRGASLLDPATGKKKEYRAWPAGLLHDEVSAVAVSREGVWFAMFGDYGRENQDFKGGGVSFLDAATGRWTSYTQNDGLARGYCCDLAVDDREVWVLHWEEELGVSVFDKALKRWTVHRRSRNGIALGGVCILLQPETAWIGQQGGLVRLDRKTFLATLCTEKEGLPGYIVSGIAAGENAVWVSAYSYGGSGVRCAGIARFARE